ncbi:aminoglycoside adenylyltransferase domain-containing protein [Microbaculum marinum]|uniref:Aminoglycoside (3'') (9) adenylyltransferase n=1 Tax=Microbaculum marinum TaxID=1764581 RepID=A0AAW9RLC1_9HYPH
MCEAAPWETTEPFCVEGSRRQSRLVAGRWEEELPGRPSKPPEQIRAAADAIRGIFQDSLAALYLHGSAVSARGLGPQSDIDLLAVIDCAMTDVQRRGLVSALLGISGRHPAAPDGPRSIEVIVFLKSELHANIPTAHSEFTYGEWLRKALEGGELPMPNVDPEYTLVLAQARRRARPLFGPPAAELLPDCALEHVMHAMRDALPALLDGLFGDERNVLLTLARMWQTAATGAIVSKDAAATWAAPQMPDEEAAMLTYAREAYLGHLEDEWKGRRSAVRRTAAFLRQRVIELVQ